MNPPRGWCWLTPWNTLSLRMGGLARQRAARTGRATGTSAGDPQVSKDWITESFKGGASELLIHRGFWIFCRVSLKHGHFNFLILHPAPLTSTSAAPRGMFFQQRPKKESKRIFLVATVLYAASVFLLTLEAPFFLPSVLPLRSSACNECSSPS